MTVSDRSDFAPITLDEVFAFPLAMSRRDLEARGVYFTDAELPELNAAAMLAPIDVARLASVHSPLDLPDIVRRRRIQYAMTTVGHAMIEQGRISHAPMAQPIGAAPTGVLDPEVWPNGLTLMRSLEHAHAQFERLDEVKAMAADDIAAARELEGFGRLFTESEVAFLFDIPEGSLKVWRSQRKHFPFIKFPGQRGIVRYPEVGLRAFVEKHYDRVTP